MLILKIFTTIYALALIAILLAPVFLPCAKLFTRIFDKEAYFHYTNIKKALDNKSDDVIFCAIREYIQAKTSYDRPDLNLETSIVYDPHKYYIIVDSGFSVLYNDDWVLVGFYRPFTRVFRNAFWK